MGMNGEYGNEIKVGLEIDYEQSLFPLRDNQGKRKSERARNRLPR